MWGGDGVEQGLVEPKLGKMSNTTENLSFGESFTHTHWAVMTLQKLTVCARVCGYVRVCVCARSHACE